jgi:hypothetical protein
LELQFTIYGDKSQEQEFQLSKIMNYLSQNPEFAGAAPQLANAGFLVSCRQMHIPLATKVRGGGKNNLIKFSLF